MLHDAAGKILRRFHGLGVMSSCWEGLSGQPDLLLCGEVVSEVPPLFVDENAAKSQNTLGPVAAPAHPGTVESNADAGGLDAEGREALVTRSFESSPPDPVGKVSSPCRPTPLGLASPA